MAVGPRPRWLVGLAFALVVLASSLPAGMAPVAEAAAQPAGLDRVAALAADGCDWLVVRDDGTVWGRGYNSDWNLGLTLPVGEIFASVPVQVPGLDGVRGAACGYAHGLAVRTDGTVWAWGRNDYGQVGVPTGDCPNHKRPCSRAAVRVPGLGGVEAVAASDYTSYALDGDGTIWAWGQVPPRDLGSADASAPGPDDAAPVRVEGLPAVAAISAIGNAFVALGRDGSVWAWGGGGGGAEPARVPGLDDVAAVAAGLDRHLALKADGGVWAWAGSNGPDPAPVAGLGPMAAIAGGGPQSAAVAEGGGVWIWGSASIGAPPKPPARVEGLEDAVALAMSYEAALVVLKADGMAWTRNPYGQVQPVPAPAPATPTP